MRKLLWLALLAPAAVRCGCAAGQDAAIAQLFAALKAQDPETALYALSQGADAKAREADGTTPLHYAAHMGDVRLIAALLKAKADPNARNDFGAMPLARGGHHRQCRGHPAAAEGRARTWNRPIPKGRRR